MKKGLVDSLNENTVFLQNSAFAKNEWLYFEQPENIITCYSVNEVADCLSQVERYTEQGYYAAGFLAYEAAAGFDVAYETHAASSDLPLLWFGIYKKPHSLTAEQLASSQPYTAGAWKPNIQKSVYEQAIARIKQHIHAGDSYQINYTFALNTNFSGEAFAFFTDLLNSQRADYSAFLNIGRQQICSLSPELFFTLDGDRVTTKPMKGTIARGMSYKQDQKQRETLISSAKDQAENLMIVDMLRNDLGRIAKSGSVKTESLFDIEQYPTVYQITSTVSAQTDASIAMIIANLFPCASITGAPKVKTMQLIQQLETQARGVYTGSIGYIAPSNQQQARRAQFNVAIRTVVIDQETQTAEYGVGGGIVWDSDPMREYEECLTKAAVLAQVVPNFEILESLCWVPVNNFFLLEEHLKRLAASAAYFGFKISIAEIEQALFDHTHDFNQAMKVRLTVNEEGLVTCSSSVLGSIENHKICLAGQASNTNSPFYYHKTTHRSGYTVALNTVNGYDDVILYNMRGEITESTIANIVLKTQDGLITPHQSCGLLNGIFRQHLLEQGIIKEAHICLNEFYKAEEIYLINSVRGWMQLEPIAENGWQLIKLNNGLNLMSYIG